MTTSAAKRGEVGPETYWTRERIIEAIRRWVELFGEPPRAADWNPSSAKYSRQLWRIPRYEAGDPETGDSWPSLNAAKRPFNGSLNAAVKAAGFEPAKPGPRRHEDVDHDLLNKVQNLHPEVGAAIGAAESATKKAEKRIRSLEAQLERAHEVNARLRADPPRRTAKRAPAKTKTITKTKIDKTAMRAAVMAERESNRVELNTLRLELASARRDSTKDASKLERAEATISELRDERRDLKRAVAQAEDRAAAITAQLDREKAKPAPSVETVVKVEREVVELPAPEAAVVDRARQLAVEAEKSMEAADLRVATAERKYLELAEAATGKARRLTAAEMAELRGRGPSGEAMFTAALRDLAKAKKKGGRQGIKEALWKIASAAVRWRDRL